MWKNLENQAFIESLEAQSVDQETARAMGVDARIIDGKVVVKRA